MVPAMAPFYTILSIWVGAIILVAMLKVSISDHEKARILGLGNDLPLGSEVGLREAMIAGRIAGPAAALDVLKKPRARLPAMRGSSVYACTTNISADT